MKKKKKVFYSQTVGSEGVYSVHMCMCVCGGGGGGEKEKWVE